MRHSWVQCRRDRGKTPPAPVPGRSTLAGKRPQAAEGGSRRLLTPFHIRDRQAGSGQQSPNPSPCPGWRTHRRAAHHRHEPGSDPPGFRRPRSKSSLQPAGSISHVPRLDVQAEPSSPPTLQDQGQVGQHRPASATDARWASACTGSCEERRQ